MTQLLISVTNTHEALMAIEAGADIIDIKNPTAGALGALPLAETRQICQIVAGHRPVSATIGEIQMKPELLMYALEHTAATGVDIVKVGFYGREHHSACIQALQALTTKGIRLIAVLFADQQADIGLLPELESTGFYGVMLDTLKKDGNNLLDYKSPEELQRFVINAKSCQLWCGLAGSLALEHVPTLHQLNPDYLGFRGAVCENSNRKYALDKNRIGRLHKVLHENNKIAL